MWVRAVQTYVEYMIKGADAAKIREATSLLHKTLKALDEGGRPTDDKVADMSEIDYVNLMRLLDCDAPSDTDYYKTKLKVQFLRVYTRLLGKLPLQVSPEPTDEQHVLYHSLASQMSILGRSIEVKKNKLIGFWNNVSFPPPPAPGSFCFIPSSRPGIRYDPVSVPRKLSCHPRSTPSTGYEPEYNMV